jgi:protein O-GlcNAc transferase
MADLTIQQTFDLALQHHQAGRLPEAERLYNQILALQPEHAGAMHYLGVIAHQLGRNDIAVDLIRRAIAISPTWPEAHSNLGAVLKDKGQLDDAIVACRRAVSLNPNYAQAHNNLGNALKSKGQPNEAIAAFRQAIALKPNYAEAHVNLGNTLAASGQLDDAIAAFRKAITLKPNYAKAHNNLGVALKDKGQLDEAITAFHQAITLQPAYADAHSNLGNGLNDKGQLDEAIAAHRQAITLRPNNAEAYGNLGNALKNAGRLDEAIVAYRQAIAIDPDKPWIDSNLVYTLHFHPAYNAQAIAEEHRRWNRQHAEPLQKLIQTVSTGSAYAHANDRNPNRRLRIGYVSPYFRTHCQSFFTVPLLSAHDRSQVEVFCYADVGSPDALTQQLQGYAQVWRNIVGQSDEQVAALIRHDRVDILVDLTMHMAHNRQLVFARKPAPVQVCWLAYPGSTGLSTIDYRLSDPYLDPPGMEESVYSERTIRLPDSFWCYDPLAGREIPVNSLPALETGFVTFGCLNNFCKINDGVLTLWAQVLRHVESSRLLLLAPQGRHRQQTLEKFGREGIDPDRIEFVAFQPHLKYLELYHRIDLGLDTFPYNGHTTSLDSFWMGVPVVTLVGQRAVSRAGWCQLSNLGLPELAGQTAEQFVHIAVELARDLPRLKELRSTFRQRMEHSPLMDGPKFARNIEAAYRQMWIRSQ